MIKTNSLTQIHFSFVLDPAGRLPIHLSRPLALHKPAALLLDAGPEEQRPPVHRSLRPVILVHLHNDPNIADQRHRVLDVGGDALLVDGEGVEVQDDGLEAAHLALRDVGMADVLLGSRVVWIRDPH